MKRNFIILKEKFYQLILRFKFIILFSSLFLSLFSFYKINNIEKYYISIDEDLKGTPIYIQKPLNQINGIVFISHGFAGSSTFMKSISSALAMSNYMTIRFDYFGHGKNPFPYTGDVTSENGATKKFISQTSEIIKSYSLSQNKLPVFIIGHSMASDIIFKVSLSNPRIISSIGLSNYTNAIQKDNPFNVLLLNGEMETFLRKKSLDIFKSVGIENPKEGIIYGSKLDGSMKKIDVVNNTGHVSILYSKQTQQFVIDWFNEVIGIESEPILNSLGFWILLLLISLVTFFLTMLVVMPKNEIVRVNLGYKKIFFPSLFSMIISPFFLYFLKFDIVKYPAHNHLIQHIFIFSVLILCFNFKTINEKFYILKKGFSFTCFFYLSFFFVIIFGGFINSYVSTFFPIFERLSLFFLLCIGCVLLCCIIQFISTHEVNAFLYTQLVRLTLIISLSISVLLKFENIFLLFYSLLLLVLFFLFFGTLGNLFNRRYSNFFSTGFVNGIVLSLCLSSAIPTYIP